MTDRPEPGERPRRPGLHPTHVRVRDARSRAFETEAHRQSLAVAESDLARDDQSFIDAVSELPGQ